LPSSPHTEHSQQNDDGEKEGGEKAEKGDVEGGGEEWGAGCVLVHDGLWLVVGREDLVGDY